PGRSGPITCSCKSAAPTTNPAFTAGGPVLVTPTVTNYNPPYNSTGLCIYVATGAVNTGSCSGRTGAQRVNDGVPTAVSQNAWNYCAKYETVLQGGLPSFTIAWNLCSRAARARSASRPATSAGDPAEQATGTGKPAGAVR